MGTRGFLGIRDNTQLLEGYFNQSDSDYEQLGEDVINLYFDGSGNAIPTINDLQEDMNFLQDGLFCEYGYVYNKENDTLEIYRGFFKKKQVFKNIKAEILNALENARDSDSEYFCHLVMIIDRKKHTKEQVLNAFEVFNKTSEDGDGGNARYYYPEHKVISLEIPENYFQLV